MIILILGTSKTLPFCPNTTDRYSVIDANTMSTATFNCIICIKHQVWLLPAE